jgi:transcriptional regulator with XRE-family HTH domain
VTGRTLGERIAEYRRQRGMSQRDLAAAMNRSESWVSQVERDVQPVERLSVLHALAQALGVSVRDLRPEAVPEADTATRPNDLDGLRLELSGHPALEQLFTASEPGAKPLDLDGFRAKVDEAWALAHESRFAALDAALTELIPALEDATYGSRDSDLRALHGLRARAYQAASAAFARQDETDAAWVAADRAITAAEQSGNPLEVVAGHFRMAHAFIRLGRYDQAEHVTTTALNALAHKADPPDATPETLSLYGAMHLVQAVISGHESDRTSARAHLIEAKKIAARISADRNDFDTEFGPTNVQLHTVAVAIDLGDAGEALEVTQSIDASGLSPERQSRLLVDIARAHAQRRHAGEALTALLDAEKLAPEHVRSHHLARDVVADLLDQFGRRPPDQLLALARRSGSAR